MRDLVVAAMLMSGLALPVRMASAADVGTFGFTLPVAPMDVRVHYVNASPSSPVVVGEGSLGANLPFDGRLTIRVPHTLGEKAVLGETHLAASYDLIRDAELLPRVSVVGNLNLPTAPGTRGVHPGVKARAVKKLRLGVLREVHVESELVTSTAGHNELAAGYRTAVGTSLNLLPGTSANFDVVANRPAAASGLPGDTSAQIGLSQILSPAAHLRLGFGAGVTTTGTSSLRSTVGVDLRF